MKRPYPSNEQVDIISSDDSSSSDAEMEATTEYDSKQSITPGGALMRRAEMYQEYMKHIPIPTHLASPVSPRLSFSRLVSPLLSSSPRLTLSSSPRLASPVLHMWTVNNLS